MHKKILVGVLVALAISLGLGYFLTHKKVTPVNVAEPKKLYVALGDSVAAGVGLDDPSDSSACNRSNNSYPNKLANDLKLDIKSFACSGATVTQGLTGAQTVNNLAIQPQIDQLTALQNVGLLTVTIGANDVGWTSMIAKCFSAECGTAEDSSQLATKMSAMTANLKTALGTLKNNPKTLAIGYYQLVPTSTKACSALLGISDQELTWLRLQEDNLNSAIQTAVTSFSFAKFIKPDFTGHELCTKEPWIQDLQQKAPFHPNVAGQNAISIQIIKDAFSSDAGSHL